MEIRRDRMATAAAATQEPRDESFPAVYSAASGYHTADGGNRVGGDRGIPATAGFRAAASGLPNHTGFDVLSRRQSGSDGVLGNCPSGTRLRANPRPAANDLDQFLWQFHHHPAI